MGRKLGMGKVAEPVILSDERPKEVVISLPQTLPQNKESSCFMSRAKKRLLEKLDEASEQGPVLRSIYADAEHCIARCAS